MTCAKEHFVVDRNLVDAGEVRMCESAHLRSARGGRSRDFNSGECTRDEIRIDAFVEEGNERFRLQFPDDQFDER